IPTSAANFEEAPEYGRTAEDTAEADGMTQSDEQDTAQAEDMTRSDEQDTAQAEDMTRSDEQDTAQAEKMPLAEDQQDTAQTELAPETEGTEETAQSEGLISDNNDPGELNTMSEVGDDHASPLFGEGYARAEADNLTAEELTGARVYDTRGEWIGEIDRLHLNDDGKIA
ncbi:hypothetical protein AB9K41_18375, partial [Cribrihabitans sp. XS_ASV171]